MLSVVNDDNLETVITPRDRELTLKSPNLDLQGFSASDEANERLTCVCFAEVWVWTDSGGPFDGVERVIVRAGQDDEKRTVFFTLRAKVFKVGDICLGWLA